MPKSHYKILTGASHPVGYQILANTHRVFLEYRGFPEDLLAVGCIEEHMANPGRRGVARVDSFGNGFVRTKRKDGQIEVRRCFKDIYQAIQMPGVSLSDMDPTIVGVLARPDEVIYHNWEREDRRWYGLKPALVGHGFSPALIKDATTVGSFWTWEQIHSVFCVSTFREDSPRESEPPATSPATVPREPRSVHYLQLVWTNPVTA